MLGPVLLLDDLGAAEILGEIVDLDDLLAQRLLVLPLRVFVGRDDSLVARLRDDVGAGAGDELR